MCIFYGNSVNVAAYRTPMLVNTPMEKVPPMGDEGLYYSITTGRQLSGNMGLFLMNYVLCNIRQMTVGAYGLKRQKETLCNNLSEGSKLKTQCYGLGNVLWQFRGSLIIRQGGSTDVCICSCEPRPSLHEDFFSSAQYHLPAGQCDVSYSSQCPCVARRVPG